MPELIREPQAHSTGAPPSPGSLTEILHADERPGRAELRRQIAHLDLELAELFISAFPRGGITYDVAPAGGPRMLGIGELEQVRDRLLARIADVRGLLRDHAYVEERNRELLERLMAEPEKYHWVRISNEDIGEPGCRHWHSRPRFGLLGMLMGWWRVKLSSGCPLARGRPASRPTEIAVASPPDSCSGPVPQAPAHACQAAQQPQWVVPRRNAAADIY